MIEKSGCILINFSSKKIGLVYREKQNDCSFPKGHLEENETLKECALRETEEETGRICEVKDYINLPLLEYNDSIGNKIRTKFYVAIDKKKSEKVFDVSLVHELIWVSIDEVWIYVKYLDTKAWNFLKIFFSNLHIYFSYLIVTRNSTTVNRIQAP